VLIGVGSPTTTVATKYFVDNVAVAGASDANDTTKGLVEMATGAEAAAGTSAGGTSARLALGGNIATSTCDFAAISVLVSLLSNGKLSDTCVDKTATYAWTGAHSWSALASFTRASTTRFSIFDTLYVGGTATSTLQGNTTATSTLRGFLNSRHELDVDHRYRTQDTGTLVR
jgi:hypothetical protein